MLRRFLLWAGWVSPQARDFPNPVAFTPPAEWEAWYTSLRATLRAAGYKPGYRAVPTFAEIKWYWVDSIPVWLINCQLPPWTDIKYNAEVVVFAGLTIWKHGEIILVPAMTNDIVVRHEMTHMLGVLTHDLQYFTVANGNFTGLQPEQQLQESHNG